MSELSHNPEQQQYYLSRAIKDFYASFRFSQGSADLQGWLYQGIVATYDHPMIETLSDHEKELFESFSALRLPVEHGDIDPKLIQREFRKQGSRFLDSMIIARDQPERPTLNPRLTAHIINHTIKRDVVFTSQDPQKVRHHRADDPYQSYFREYILRATPTGTLTFDRMFSDIRDAISSKNVDPRAFYHLDTLVGQWESLHPGVSFGSHEE